VVVRTFAAAAVAVAALALAGAGAGKQPLTALAVCGVAACSEPTQDSRTLGVLQSAFQPDPQSLLDTPPLGRYVELRAGAGWEEPLGYFVPRTAVIKWGWPGAVELWIGVDAHVLSELERLAATVEPKPRPRLAGVVVNGRRARVPARYLPLFAPLQRAPRPRAAGPIWIPITFLWRSSNPWSGDDSTMLYDRDDRALLRSGVWYRVPRSLGRLITRAASARG
jgi:hypothetical protein